MCVPFFPDPYLSIEKRFYERKQGLERMLSVGTNAGMVSQKTADGYILQIKTEDGIEYSDLESK